MPSLLMEVAVLLSVLIVIAAVVVKDVHSNNVIINYVCTN